MQRHNNNMGGVWILILFFIFFDTTIVFVQRFTNVFVSVLGTAVLMLVFWFINRSDSFILNTNLVTTDRCHIRFHLFLRSTIDPFSGVSVFTFGLSFEIYFSSST